MKNAFATVSREIRNGVFDADMDDLMTVIRDRRSVIGAVRKTKLEVGKWYQLVNVKRSEGRKVICKKINRTRAVMAFYDDAAAKLYTIPFACLEDVK